VKREENDNMENECLIQSKGYFLYLFKFNDNNYFKFGRTCSLAIRLKQHDKSYSINVNESIVFEYESRSYLFLVEGFLKQVFPDVADHPKKGLNGSTEIREVKYFLPMLNFLREKFSYLKFSERNLSKYSDLFKNEFKRKIAKKNKVKPMIDNVKEYDYHFEKDLLNTIDNLFDKFEELILKDILLRYSIKNNGYVFFLWNTKGEILFDTLYKTIFYPFGCSSFGLCSILVFKNHNYSITRVDFCFDKINKEYRYGINQLLTRYNSCIDQLDKRIKHRNEINKKHYCNIFLKPSARDLKKRYLMDDFSINGLMD